MEVRRNNKIYSEDQYKDEKLSDDGGETGEHNNKIYHYHFKGNANVIILAK